ncbi:hypothetical protein CA267_007120 [Alteromonas pelagimontana]|uniref:Uncharacterized protein n=1 Tax=Alteromonas pelagimontana TaxID=1858656 RepID=A0A6M4MBJ9_9ALTE|nr:hypothetical protein [Alteromonas pelagimontana]QJR80561.1 hypothetical protein CA267_007120 [Alteromonas pelagimontana]
MFKSGRTKALLAVCGLATGIWVSQVVGHVTPEAACDHQLKMEFNSALSATHLQNPCLPGETSHVSWLSWVSGKSQSYQFHFLDLLELLYGKSGDGEFNPPTSR